MQFGSFTSSQGSAHPVFPPLVLDSVHVDSSTTSRTHSHVAAALFTVGMSQFGLLLLTLDAITIGSPTSFRVLACLRSAAFMLADIEIGSAMAIRSHACSSLAMSVLDSVNYASSVLLHGVL